MARKGPGRHYRKGLTLVDLIKKFTDNDTAEKWFVEKRWLNGITCPKCKSTNILHRENRKPQPYRCRSCKKYFSVKTDSLMHNSPLDFQTWAIAVYLLTTNIKGVSSMKLHRDLGITQKTAWHLAMRLRDTYRESDFAFSGPVEVDETYIGGKAKNMHKSKRKKLTGRGGVDKEIVVGIKDRKTKQIVAKVVPNTGKATLQGFIEENVDEDAEKYTDENRSYMGLKNHEAVNHSVGEYVREQAHTNGMESFWSLLKRGYNGTYHKMSPWQLHRYVDEFAGRHNARALDTADQMDRMAARMDGRRLPYAKLIEK